LGPEALQTAHSCLISRRSPWSNIKIITALRRGSLSKVNDFLQAICRAARPAACLTTGRMGDVLVLTNGELMIMH